MLHNDEGMWLLNALPLARLKELYGFEPTPEWIEHVQKASVRMNNGGSASFVSADGLLVTNHHVAESVLQELSSEGKDYVQNGFYAKNLNEEAKAPALEVNVLWEIEDVTDRVQAVRKEGMSAEESCKAVRAIIAQIEGESHAATGLRSNVVTLYNGGKYHLYRYKKYTDVRLVFAPERNIAGFGGDFDNYEYPRFCLDCAFFRVYGSDGKPLHTPHYFAWETENSLRGTLSFVSGHPGTTDRLSTLSRIAYLRDEGLPYTLNFLRRDEITLQQYAGRSLENKRRAHHALHRVQNLRKRFIGQLAALQDPQFLASKEGREIELRGKIEKDPVLAQKYGDAWDMVAKALERRLWIRDRLNFFEGGLAFATQFFHIARTIVRLAEEDKKPNPERLREYVDSSRDSLMQGLLSPAPIYPDMEEWLLADSLALFAEVFGFTDFYVTLVLDGKSPKARARELIAGTKLHDVLERKKLIDGGEKAVRESEDPFIKLALAVDHEARTVRKIFEAEIVEVEQIAYGKIAQVMFEVYGDEVYPDATFTLRLAYGRILGFDRGASHVQPFTYIGDVFAHADMHGNESPWNLPYRWKENKDELLRSRAQFNFITTHDTHGGNSGSPVFTPDLKIIGLLFDGTVEGLGDTFVYTDTESRSVSVHAAGIYEVLRSIYDTEQRLIHELKLGHFLRP